MFNKVQQFAYVLGAEGRRFYSICQNFQVTIGLRGFHIYIQRK